MRYRETGLEILMRNRGGTPFVFWEPVALAILIRHGHHITFIRFSDGETRRSNPHAEEMERLIRDQRGRVVASYLETDPVVVIKYDGDAYRFRVPGTPVETGTVDGRKHPMLVTLLDINAGA